MVTFRNNNGRRSNFRRNDRNFKSNGDRNKFNNNFSTAENFQRKMNFKNKDLEGTTDVNENRENKENSISNEKDGAEDKHSEIN